MIGSWGRGSYRVHNPTPGVPGGTRFWGRHGRTSAQQRPSGVNNGLFFVNGSFYGTSKMHAVCVCCFLHCFLNIHHDVSLPFQLPRLREWDGNGMGMTNAFVIHHIHLREQRPFVPFAIALDMHGPMVHLHGQDLDRSRLSQLTATPRHPFPIPWTVAVGVAMQDTFCHVDHLWSGRSYDLQLRQVQPSGGGVSRERIQA